MAEIDETSATLGQLRAEVENDRRSREMLHQKMERINEQLTSIPLLVQQVAAMQPEVSHYADARRRIAGGMAVLLVLAGAVGAALAEGIKLLMHKGS